MTEDTKPLPGEKEVTDDDTEQPDEPVTEAPDEQPKTDEAPE